MEFIMQDTMQDLLHQLDILNEYVSRQILPDEYDYYLIQWGYHD